MIRIENPIMITVILTVNLHPCEGWAWWRQHAWWWGNLSWYRQQFQKKTYFLL